MKYILILLLFPVYCFSQDSSKIKTSGIVLKGKDCDMILLIVKANVGNYPDLDSLLKLKYRNPPGNNTDVTLDSIPGKQWLRVALSAKINMTCLLEGVFTRIDAELRLHGNGYITSRLNNDKTISDAAYDTAKKDGQKYGKKQDDD